MFYNYILIKVNGRSFLLTQLNDQRFANGLLSPLLWISNILMKARENTNARGTRWSFLKKNFSVLSLMHKNILVLKTLLVWYWLKNGVDENERYKYISTVYDQTPLKECEKIFFYVHLYLLSINSSSLTFQTSSSLHNGVGGRNQSSWPSAN